MKGLTSAVTSLSLRLSSMRAERRRLRYSLCSPSSCKQARRGDKCQTGGHHGDFITCIDVRVLRIPPLRRSTAFHPRPVLATHRHALLSLTIMMASTRREFLPILLGPARRAVASRRFHYT